MSDPPRWVDGPLSDVRARLFQAGADDAPPKGASARTVAALGLTPLPTSSSSPATLVARVVASRTPWLVVAGGVGLLAVAVGTRSVPRHEPRELREPPDIVGALPPTEPIAAPWPAKSPDAPAPPKVSFSPSPQSPQHELPVGADGLAAELSFVDHAREELGRGHASETVRLLDQYTQRFPTGRLGQEALVLRAEALASLGDRAGAKRIARGLLAAHPYSPYGDRLQNVLAQ